ncbi:MAG: GNAT family N-acetyltransferase [Flavobacterium sp.]|nr:MAG: GNAT family N-acetyltransferase [Flavobacterium sp.]
MKNYTVRPYQTQDFEDWNAFIGKAKNATFLFHRDFMEYHKDRFQDFSLIVEEDKKWVAILPANRVDDTLFSHQGLTYGGLVYDEKLKMASFLNVFKAVLFFLNENRIDKLQLKLIPSFYTDFFAEELNYALFLSESKLTRRDTLSVIKLTTPSHLSKDRKEGVNRGKKNALVIKETNDFDSFWNEILIPNLEDKHQAKPVHSVEEIKLLHSRFPQNIRQFNVYKDDKIVAGTTIFETRNVAHSQYISGNSTKNELGSLDFLHHHLLTKVFKDKLYFDFGTSNENQGKNLNKGLSYWKESFGANTVVQDFYEVATSNYDKFENVLV